MSSTKEQMKENYWKLKHELINIYGGRCVCCSESRIEFLTIDHINNDGAKHKKELRAIGETYSYSWLKKNINEDTFQCLCWNCQWGKKRTGICPHKQTITPE